jgi:UDP-N-acetyl-D-galactosamine dehydrogenase
MDTYRICVIGVGYVGLELAVNLAEHFSTIGFDTNSQRIKQLSAHMDSQLLITKQQLQHKNLSFTNDVQKIRDANIYIICVPTPVVYYKRPDISLLLLATETIAGVLKKNDIVIYESSVYPGTTEERCLPKLEEKSGLKEGRDFYIAYSPERINPGDNIHSIKNTTKLIAAKNPKCLLAIKHIYEKICAKVFCCSSIGIAEASKMLENTQRDVNIALMNEFTQIMHAINLDMQEVIKAASTKYNFIPYSPGLVGGHCISIDPEYMVFLAQRHGIQTPLISSAREVNNRLTQFILSALLKFLIQAPHHAIPYQIGIFGLTYKPNVPDTRNSLVFKFIKECADYPFEFQLHDPFFENKQVSNNPKFTIKYFDDINMLDICMLFVGHDAYHACGIETFISKCKKPVIIMDIASMFYTDSKPKDIRYWHL